MTKSIYETRYKDIVVIGAYPRISIEGAYVRLTWMLDDNTVNRDLFIPDGEFFEIRHK